MRWTTCAPIGVALFLAFSCHVPAHSNPPHDIDMDMASLSAQAVDRAKSNYGVTLDYSPDSVKEVEKLLAAKYDLQKTQPMPEMEVADAAHLWGAYIGEVLKRARPGHWVRDSAAMGKDALPVVLSDTGEESYPCAWVYHRLKNGEEDNVWIKFHFVTQPGGLRQYLPPKKKAATASGGKNAPG